MSNASPATIVDVLVVGAGVVGLAAAADLAARGRSVAIAERHRRPGVETSTHNSGVIHAGIYYPAGTLKASLCVEGAERLYAFCAEHGVEHSRCGKLIVAEEAADVSALEHLHQLGTANGVRGLEVVDTRFIARREPHVTGAAALWSPNTGRVEAEGVVRALLRQAERHDVMLLRASMFQEAVPRSYGFDVRCGEETFAARTIVNAAGLYADEVARACSGEAFTIYPCRGEYAELKPARRAWVNGLVYPPPHPSGHGLGVHLTKTTAGSVLLGPTIRYQAEKDDYESGREPLESFAASARRLLPAITPDDITYGGSGIRAKLHPPSERFADFMVRPDTRQPALIHAAGIDSPGLTACLAIGSRVGDLVAQTFSR